MLLEYVKLAIKRWKIIVFVIIILVSQCVYIKLLNVKISNLNLELELASKDIKTKESVIRAYEVKVNAQNKAIAKWKSDALLLMQQVENANKNIDNIRASYEEQINILRASVIGGQTLILTEGNCKLVRKDSSKEVNELWKKVMLN